LICVIFRGKRLRDAITSKMNFPLYFESLAQEKAEFSAWESGQSIALNKAHGFLL
jgi:hypothetical protein